MRHKALERKLEGFPVLPRGGMRPKGLPRPDIIGGEEMNPVFFAIATDGDAHPGIVGGVKRLA